MPYKKKRVFVTYAVELKKAKRKLKKYWFNITLYKFSHQTDQLREVKPYPKILDYPVTAQLQPRAGSITVGGKLLGSSGKGRYIKNYYNN